MHTHHSRKRLLAAVVFTSLIPVAPPGLAADAAHPFEPIATVLTHPRCMNCHTVTGFPRQGDLRLRHAQHVMRGADGKGSPAMRCTTCHQTSNQGRVPGVKDWHLAPLSMGWEGLSSGGLCAAIKDPARNGGRKTGEQVIEHMKTDPLVLWAWQPGADRSTPPLSHAGLLAALSHWAEQGMPCPN
jgi:hypothetical protein